MEITACKREEGGRFTPALCVRCPYSLKERVKILGGRWDPVEQWWELPYTPEDWQSVLLSIPGIRPDAAILAELSAPSVPLDAPLPDAPPMPLREGISPFQHQLAAYCMASSLFQEVV